MVKPIVKTIVINERYIREEILNKLYYEKGKRKRSHVLTGHIQWKQSLSPRSLELRGIFKRTDDHIFEKTLKIELSPIPQAYRPV
jgi:hypothetical protein